MARWDDLFAPRVLIQSSFDDMDLSDFSDAIVSMEYTSSVRKMDKCVLTIENRDGRFSEDPRLDQEIRFLCKWGYPSGLTYAREMIAVSVAPVLANGVPVLVLTAYGQGQMLMTTRSRNWGSLSSSDVARRIASDHGLSANIVDSGDARTENRVQSPQMSDYEFLARLAERINYDFSVTQDTLTFVPVDTSASPSHRFVYYVDGGSIVKSFRPSTKRGRIHRRDVAGSTSSGTPVQATPQRSQRALGTTSMQSLNLLRSSLGPRIRITEESRGSVVRPSPETSDRIHRLHSSADNHVAEMSAVDMTLDLVGYPTVEASQIIEVYVVERRYSGLWRVTEARHRIESVGSYDTTLKLHRAEVNSSVRSPAAVPSNQRNRNGTARNLPPIDAFAINTDRSTGRRLEVVTTRRSP
jgi:phage protein D